MPVVAIYNPTSGDRSAHAFFSAHVLPLLAAAGKPADKVLPTESAGHAGQLLADFLNAHDGDVTVVLGSGDGTLHDIVNFLPKAQLAGARAGAPPARLHFALVPCGTANALYSSCYPPQEGQDPVKYRLQSVQAFVDGKAPAPLTLAITTLSGPPGKNRTPPEVAVSAVVTSTAFHARLLKDSEALRESHPGIERFKLAAAQNTERWYSAWAKLLPAPAARVVEVWDPAAKAFVPHPESAEDDPIVDADGPFAYFLSTVNVDRLEPAFVVTPLAKRVRTRPTEATLEVVMVRPFESPAVEMDTLAARKAFAEKLMGVMKGAYEDGKHIDYRYTPEGDVVLGGDGPPVVEYVRCGGWEWVPDDIDEAAHTLCADGAIFEIKKGGRAVCSAATPDGTAGFMVFRD